MKAGHVAILDARTMHFAEREVMTDVPAGWLPPDTGYGPMEMMGFPEFTGERTFRINIPTGAVECFELP